MEQGPEPQARGTSEDPATVRARLATTPLQRVRWLEEVLHVAERSGALARIRAQRQRELESWWASGGRS